MIAEVKIDFLPFLLKAKQKTWAANANSAPLHMPGFKLHDFSQDALHYKDAYTGFTGFSGLETVYCLSQPIWCMSYHGRLIQIPPDIAMQEALGIMRNHLPEHSFAKKVYAFLKQALLANKNILRFRGPESFVQNNFEYECDQSGDCDWFEGFEKIYYQERQVYECKYSGQTLLP